MDKKELKKKALVIRHAAWGDLIQASCVLPYLKNDGYTVHFMTNLRGVSVLQGNPNIDKFVYYADDSIHINQLSGYYEFIAEDYDKCVVLTQSVEGKFLVSYPDPRYYRPIRLRRKECDENYYESMIRAAGYEPNGLRTGQLYFTGDEIAFGRNIRNQLKNKFVVLWVLSGSSMHKVYRYYEEVARRVLHTFKDAFIIACGMLPEMSLSFIHPRVWNLGFQDVSIKQACMLTKIADLVIGPETALLNAAGCFDTPKIAFCTHSSLKNLTATWRNDFSLQAACWCSPCHLLHKYAKIWRNVCMEDRETGFPQCTGDGFPPGLVFYQISKVYDLHKQGAFYAV